MKWLPILAFIALAYYLVGANFSARLGIIDDHEIPLFLGQDGKIAVSEIPQVLAGTEVGKWGEYQRFRPSYYGLRVMEAAVWRDNASGWYAFRFLLLVVSLCLGWLILTNYFPPLIAYLTVFYLMTQTYWSDIWNRLGPSEAYAVPAVLMSLYGMMKGKVWMVAAGYAIAVGSKENLLVLLPFLGLFAGLRIWKKLANRNEILIYLLLGLYTIWIVAGIYLGTQKTGGDVYGTSLSLKDRLLTLYSYKRYIIESRNAYLPVLLGVAAAVGAVFLGYKHGLRTVIRHPLAKPMVTILAIAGVIGSQFIFYNNQLPSNSRYDFPAMTLFPILNLTAVYALIQGLPRKNPWKTVRFFIYGVTAIVLIVLTASRGYSQIRERGRQNAVATQKFAVAVDQATLSLKQNPDSRAIFVSANYWDYEPTVSVARYLESRGVENRFELHYQPLSPADNPLGQELENRMKGVMEGVPDPDRVFTRFSPVTDAPGLCVSLIFGKAQPKADCPLQVNF